MQKKLQTRLLKRLKMQKLMASAFGLLAFLFSIQVQAQTPLYFKTGTGTGGNTIPLNQSSQKTQLLYTPTDFGTAPISGSITKIYFRNSTANTTATYSNFKVSFLQNNDAAIPSTSYYTGLTPVHFAASQTVNANATAGGWFEIPLQAPYFQYDNTKTLIIEIQYTAITGGISTTTSTSTGNKRVSGTSLTATTGTANTTWNDFGLDIVAATPCSGAPTAGTATTNFTNICAGSDFTLNLSGISTGTGLTFQWQTSPNGTTGWTPVGPSSNYPIFTTSQASGTHHYRAIVTCGTQTATSAPVIVTSPALINGSFTIDNNAPASATNFQSFTAAINSLNCGINGAVTFTVAANSGPYNEQIEITEITGASATNTITFQGNGRTISADPATGNRAIIKLNGADFVTINNLNIATTGTSTTAFGWGIHFINGADNNTISNSTISIGSLSITASNSVGIVFANSTSTATTVGNNGNNNLITGNTILGGYRGIRLNGTATGGGNNQIRNNTIKDFYAGGIEIDDANATKIEGNDISRPTRQVVTAFDGIALSGTTINTIINKNRIHNSHGAATTLTSTAYGISSTSNDAAVGSENIVKNNLIYDLNSTGTVNGIHNTGSNGIFYYNNTINIDNAASTAIARGFYQTTAASNIKFINNNVVVSNGGVATNQHAIYLNIATSTVESNRNNLFVPTGNIGFYNAISYATLASWQAANTTAPFDLNSVSADPFFVSAATGNLTPTNGVLNNVGQALPAVTDDFTGAVRNATTPDIGAYEFTPSTLDLGVTALVTPAAKNCFSNAEPVTVTITNFGTAAIDFSTITANVTVNVTGAATPTPLTVPLTNAFNGGQPLAPAASMNVLVGNVNMTAAGTYTFNAATAVTAGGSDGTASNNAMPATDITVSPLAAGTASATNANLCLSGVTTLNLTGNTGGNIQWQSGTSATGPFTNIAGATGNSYTLTTPITATTYYQAVSTCGTNTVTSNVVTVTVNNPTPPTVAPVSRCGAGPVTLTTSVPAGTPVNWYTAATGGAPVASGATYSPNITATTTFYATVGGTTVNVGPTTNAIGATSGSATAIYYQIFDVLTPLTLNSVYVYPVAAGNVNLHISNSAGTVLQSISVPVTAADVNQKTLIPINYFLPVGTAYRIGWATGGVSLLRNSAGATYPYTVPGVISVTGNSFTSGANYWYAAYDWSVSSGCESARTPVVATVTPLPTTPTVTRAGNVLTSSAATGNQWYLNGVLIPGATGQTHTATASGTYTVTTTVNTCTSAASTGVSYVLGVNGELAGMSVDVYPNPATGSFNVKLNGYQKDANVVLYNLAGQKITTEKVSADGNATSISLKGLAAGTYLLKVTSEKGVQVNRLIVQ